MSEHALTFVLGGARSGKSAYAERLIAGQPAPWRYIATAQAYDDEMRARIGEHRARRGGQWETHEASIRLAETIEAASAGQPMLIDCLTLWLTNIMLAEHDVAADSRGLVKALKARRGPWVVVSNEVGFGIVPDNALARRFRDAAGRLNQMVATEADHVVLMVAGLPVKVK